MHIDIGCLVHINALLYDHILHLLKGYSTFWGGNMLILQLPQS